MPIRLSSARRACSTLLGEVWQCHLLRTLVAFRLTASVRTGIDVSSCAEAKEAVRRCNRCKFLKNKDKWFGRLLYRDGDVQSTWLCEAPPTQAWGLGCKLCRAKCAAPEQSSSPFVRFTKGSVCREAPPTQLMVFTFWASRLSFAFSSEVPLTRFGDVLQLQDLKRHEETDLHVSSLLVEQPVEAVSAKADATAPTAGQVHLAIQVLMEPRSGQSVGYASRCELAHRSDPGNFPLQRASPCEHSKIISALAAVYTVDGERAEGQRNHALLVYDNEVLHAQRSEVSNIRLLALATEWLTMASRFVHEYDRGSTKEGAEPAQTSAVANVARCSRLTLALEQDHAGLSVSCQFFFSGGLAVSFLSPRT
ncbi:unnamed protein product [Symbiodinium sp. CCMP2592]|nr:unnamed protein product [Symbiodinium sp. CCMP2592]